MFANPREVPVRIKLYNVNGKVIMDKHIDARSCYDAPVSAVREKIHYIQSIRDMPLVFPCKKDLHLITQQTVHNCPFASSIKANIFSTGTSPSTAWAGDKM